MTADIAQCLLAGIYGDTLGLRTEATTARTMRTAADLVDAGANPAAITDALVPAQTAVDGLPLGACPAATSSGPGR